MGPGRDHGRIADIEVLRAVAIICVLIEHAFFNLVFDEPWLPHLLDTFPLWCGVDLFLVISGFVVTRQLQASLASGRLPRRALRQFWIARAFRLWPAAWFWLALMIVGSLLFRNPPFLGTLPLNLGGARAAVLGFANFRLAHMPMQPYGASYAYWSLSLEEQFYLLLPLMIWGAGRWLAIVAACLLLVQLPLPHPRLYFFLRNDGLLWGVLLAASPTLMAPIRRAAAAMQRHRGAGWLVLVLMLGIITQLSPEQERSPGFLLGLMAACCAVLVGLASADRDLFHAGRLQPVLRWFGSRSYALYLCHIPIYQCAAAWSHNTPASEPVFGAAYDLRSCAICLALLPASAEATRRWIEEPLRRFGRRLGERAAV